MKTRSQKPIGGIGSKCALYLSTTSVCAFLVIFLFFLLAPVSFSSSFKAFLIQKDFGSKLLITDGYSQYILEYNYQCYSSDFNEGDYIYINTYSEPSFWNDILVDGLFNTKTCKVSSAEKVNLKQYFVNNVMDSDSIIIIEDKLGSKYLVEYGIGCLSMWRYEGKYIDIDIGGIFLNGISDRIYLFDSDDDCKVWDAEEINSSSGFNVPVLPSPTPTLSCPTNSALNGASCFCNEGYLMRNNQCITHTQDCINTYGNNVYGTKGNNNSSCYCNSGYQWNTSKTACVVMPKIAGDSDQKLNAETIPEGALIKATGDIDVYIVKYIGTKKFKRLILSPHVFESYAHFDKNGNGNKWDDILDVDQSVIDSFITSKLVKAVGDTKVYQLTAQGDTGVKRWINLAAQTFLSRGYDSDAIYEINAVDRDSYVTGTVIE